MGNEFLFITKNGEKMTTLDMSLRLINKFAAESVNTQLTSHDFRRVLITSCLQDVSNHRLHELARRNMNHSAAVQQLAYNLHKSKFS